MRTVTFSVAFQLRRLFAVLVLCTVTSVFVLLVHLHSLHVFSSDLISASQSSDESFDPEPRSAASSGELITLFASKSPEKIRPALNVRSVAPFPALFFRSDESLKSASRLQRIHLDQIEHERNQLLMTLLQNCSDSFARRQLIQLPSNPRPADLQRLLERLAARLSSSESLSSCTDRWQSVAGTSDLLQVYSAYLDFREQRVVRVVAIARTRSKPAFHCVLWLPNNHLKGQNFTGTFRPSSRLVPGTARPVRENWGLAFSAFYLHCQLPDHIPAPIAVTVVLDQSNVSATSTGAQSAVSRPARFTPSSAHSLSNLILITNHLRVQPVSWFANMIHDHSPLSISHAVSNLSESVTGQLAVCVKPIHFDYDQLNRLMEFVQFNRLLGVSHFVLYVQSVGPHVACLLRQFESRRIVTLLPWQGLRVKSQIDIRTQNLFAALNDCSMRLVGRYRYAAMIDLDELIVPRIDMSLVRLLARLRSLDRLRPMAGAYSFQNAFFYMGWPDDSAHSNRSLTTVKSLSISHRDDWPVPIVLRKTMRRSDLHPHRQRSKLIVRPDALLEVGNHFVWQFVAGFGAVHVNSRAAMLHHYRVCEFGGDKCLKSKSIVDRRVHAWNSSLLSTLEQVRHEYRDTCQPPLSLSNG